MLRPAASARRTRPRSRKRAQQSSAPTSTRAAPRRWPIRFPGRHSRRASTSPTTQSVQAMVQRSVNELGGVDILVNNAALMAQLAAGGMSTLGFPPDMWNQAFAVNVTGAWNVARAAVPEMIKRGGGSIVNQSSIGAIPAESVYGITKLAMIGLTTTLARGARAVEHQRESASRPDSRSRWQARCSPPTTRRTSRRCRAAAAMRVKGDPSESARRVTAVRLPRRPLDHRPGHGGRRWHLSPHLTVATRPCRSSGRRPRPPHGTACCCRSSVRAAGRAPAPRCRCAGSRWCRRRST